MSDDDNGIDLPTKGKGTIQFPTKKVEPTQTLNYTKWIAEGYLYVINKALKVVANDPNPEAGKYCMEIGFKTGFPGVIAPEWITKDQPMLKIILNHQFFDLVVEDTFFSVRLYFGGVETTLSIPFAAIVWFHDGDGFTLSFEYPINDSSPAESVNPEEPEETTEPEKTTAEIVSLDAFRSNNNDEKDID